MDLDKAKGMIYGLDLEEVLEQELDLENTKESP